MTMNTKVNMGAKEKVSLNEHFLPSCVLWMAPNVCCLVDKCVAKGGEKQIFQKIKKETKIIKVFFSVKFLPVCFIRKRTSVRHIKQEKTVLTLDRCPNRWKVIWNDRFYCLSRLFLKYVLHRVHHTHTNPRKNKCVINV